MSDKTINYGTEWAKSNTLGKANPFRWKLDSNANLYISRQFRNKDTYRKVDSKLSTSQLNQVAAYVKEKKIVRLANSVSGLGNKTEDEGLGVFMHENLKLSITEAQTSSQLAALFVEAGIWKLVRNRGMNFQHIGADWEENLRDYYNHRINEITT